MSLYRGAGGASDATDDSTVNAVAGYASAAASSASAAATSATNASNSATAAASSASSAASSASSVATNASNAASSAGLANTYATAASASKDAAAASATTASTKAGQASSSASEAGSSASTAAVHATNASNSASAAAASASDAATSASNAADSAADALAIYGNTTDMNNAVAAAATSAVNAATSAAEADDSRVLAEAAVTGASSYASAAQASANDSQAYAGASEAFKDSALAAASDANTYATNAGARASDAADSALEAANSAAAAAAVSGSGNGTFVNTPITTNSTVTLSSGTANGVAYLNGSKALTTGSALTFDGGNLGLGVTPTASSNYAIFDIKGRATGQSAILSFFDGAGTKTGAIQSDTNFGVLLGASGARPIAFFTNGTERARIDSTGLGIGTTSPTNALSVSGNANITGNTTLGDATTDTVTVNGYMGVGGAPASYIGLNIVNTALAGAIQIGSLSNPTFTSAATTSAASFYGKLSTQAASFTLPNAYAFYAEDATKGAGSTITNQYGLYVRDQTQGTNNYGITSLVSSGSNKWNIYASGTAANYFAGNVGLGVTPSAWNALWKAFEIGGSGNGLVSNGGVDTRLYMNTYYTSGGVNTYGRTAAASLYVMASSGQHQWFTAPSGTAGTAISFTQAMTLDVSGNLLVGTTNATPSIGVVLFKDATRGIVRAATTVTTADALAEFYNPNGKVGQIVTNGTATSYATSSDYRLKENVQPMTGALAKVAQLKPVTYTWKTDGSAGEGFIAHELAEVCPQAVTGEKDAVEIQQYEISPAVPATYDEEGNELTPAVEAVMGEREVPKYQGIDVSFLVGTLTAAIQEQQAMIQELTARVTQLESK